jgi:hypothetical protein
MVWWRVGGGVEGWVEGYKFYPSIEAKPIKNHQPPSPIRK